MTHDPQPNSDGDEITTCSRCGELICWRRTRARRRQPFNPVERRHVYDMQRGVLAPRKTWQHHSETCLTTTPEESSNDDND